MALISLEHVSKVYPKGTRPALMTSISTLIEGISCSSWALQVPANHIAEPVAARGGGHGWRDSRRR